MAEGLERRLSLRARDIRARGQEALTDLPSPEELAARADVERHRYLEGLRLELYGISTVVADATVQRALDDRPAHPPYGLVRSMHSSTRLVSADPDPVEAGSIDSFHTLGRAYLDTMVFHLDRQLKAPVDPGQGWVLGRLEQLLALFRIDAGPATRARLRDGFSFMYGGLHFGVSVCAQLNEVMSSLLGAFPEMAPADKAEVIKRSIRPAYRMAAMNLDHVVSAYQSLQARGPRSGWMSEERFVVQDHKGSPWKIDLVDDGFGTRADGRRPEDLGTTYTTLGCPARSSSSGGTSAIAVLWTWCVELALEAGLLA